MRTLRTTILLVVAGFVLAACARTHPVYSPRSHAGMKASGEDYTVEEVRAAVVNGLTDKGWTVLERSDGDGAGYVTGEVRSGGHWAQARVDYNAAGWTITHVDSSPGLRYNPDRGERGAIHARYNHWIRLLDDRIRRNIRR